jgi:hypothetical protein
MDRVYMDLFFGFFSNVVEWRFYRGIAIFLAFRTWFFCGGFVVIGVP